MSGVRYWDRKNKLNNLLDTIVKEEVKDVIKLVKPFYNDVIIEDFDLNDDFLFNRIENLDKDIKYFLDKEIDYSLEADSIITILEKSYYTDVFLKDTIRLIRMLCEKITTDLKQSEIENIEQV